MKSKMNVVVLSMNVENEGTSVHAFKSEEEVQLFLVNHIREIIKGKVGSRYDKMNEILNAADFAFDGAWNYFKVVVNSDNVYVWEGFEIDIVCPQVDALLCACHAALPFLASSDDPECDPSTTFADRGDTYKTVRDCIVAAGGEVEPETKFSKCAECSEVYTDADLEFVEEQAKIICDTPTPPTGHCPSCGGLCYTTEDRP